MSTARPQRSRIFRFGAVALVIGAIAIASGIGLRSATTWNPGDIFVGMDNEFFGDIPGAPTPGQYHVFGSDMTPKEVVTLTDLTSYTTGCTIDPTETDGDLWTAGFWDRKITRISSLDPHPIVSTFDLTADISLPPGSPCPYADDPNTCAGAAVQLVFAKDGTFYVGTAFGQGKVLHYNKLGQKLDEYAVDITGFRGAEYLDLGADQETLYYTGLDDNGVTEPVIHRYDLSTGTQLSSIPLTGAGGGRLSTHVYAFRVLPPGDGSGGYIVATDLHVYQVDASGQLVRDFLDTPDFRRQMGDADFNLFIDANLSNDGRYLLSAAYAEVADDGVDENGAPLTDANGNTLLHVVVPTKLFKFHIATGTLQSGPIDIGSVGDRRTADTLCVAREYIASLEQPDCALNPGDYRCSPPPNCSLPGSEDNPFCAVPGLPTISYPDPDGSTIVTGQPGVAANVQVVAALFAGDGEVPASPGPLSYTAGPLPGGVSIDPDTGLISGTATTNGELDVVVTATDQSNGRAATAHFTWKIGNAVPVIAAVPDQTSPLGIPIAPVSLSATDLDAGDAVSFSQSFGAAPLTGLMIQAIDGRSAQIVGTPSLPSGYACPGGVCGAFPVTVHASDGHSPEDPSQTGSFTWTITNQAPSAPVLTSPPAGLTIHIGTLVSLNVTSTDPNGDPVNYSLQITPPAPGVIAGLVISSGGLISGGPPVLGTYLVKVVADDLHGGISSTTLTLNVTNTGPTAPVLVTPPSSLDVHIGGAASFGVQSIDPDGDAVVYSLSSVVPAIPGLSISPAGVVTGTPPALLASYQITVVATDPSGATGSAVFTLNVTNHAPSVPVASGSLSIHLSTAAAIQVTSVDPDAGDVVHYSLTVTPPAGVVNSNLSISATGLISGIPPALGVYQLLVTADDGLPSGISSKTFTLTVTNLAPGTPVLQSPISSLTVHAGNPASFQVKSIDPDGDAVGYSLAVTPPIPGMSISSTGLVTGTPAAVGAYQVTVTADDHLGGVSSAIFVLNATNLSPTAPVLQSPASSLNIHIGSPAAIQVQSTDPDGDAIAYSLQVTPPAPGIIPGLSISSTGLITGTPPVVGTYLVTVTASDAFGGSNSTLLTLVVSQNLAPSCIAASASPGLLWPPNHKFVTIAINGLTDPDGDALTITINRILQDEPTYGPGADGDGNTPTDGLIVGGSKAQVRAERSGNGNGRIYVIRFTATDPSGATCSGSVTVGVPHDRGGPGSVPIDSLVRYDSLVAGGPPLSGPEFNLPPVYTNPGVQSGKVGVAVSLNTTAIDLNLDPLSYSALGLPPGLAINTTSGKITGSPTTVGTYTVTLSASDPFGASGSATFTWIVTANRPPVAALDSVTIYKGSSIKISVLANDSDPDGDTLTLVSVQGNHSGTARLDGSKVYYKPSSSFTGIDQFTYTIKDSKGATATGTIRAEVVNHHDDDDDDHDHNRNGHHDGDGCERDRYKHSQH